MTFYENFSKKYKDFQQYISKKKDANFLSFGLFCPIIFSSYRFYLKDNYTIYSPMWDHFGIERFLENVTVLFLLPYILFFFLAKKKPEFYDKIYEKINLIFPVLWFFYVLMWLLSINIFTGCIGIVCLYFLYFYCLFMEYSVIYCKTLIIPCTIALHYYINNCNENSYILKKHPKLLYIGEQLKKENYKSNIDLLTKFCLIPTILFLKLDTTVMYNVIVTNNHYNEILENVEKQIDNLENLEIKKKYQILKEQKETLFQSYRKKHLFFRAAIYIFGSSKKAESFQDIGKKIEKFSVNG